MTYKELQSKGELICESDAYDGGIYLFTHEYWGVGNKDIYVHEIHPNANRYTGDTCTYHKGDINDFKKYGAVAMGFTVDEEEQYDKVCKYLGIGTSPEKGKKKTSIERDD